MINLGNPEQAFEVSRLPNDGVGLARLEFIINTSIRVHPRAVLEYPTLAPALQEQITAICALHMPEVVLAIEQEARGTPNTDVNQSAKPNYDIV